MGVSEYSSVQQKYELYGAEPSLYTGKVRSYLRYKEIPYTESPPTFQNLRKVIVPRTGKVMIPVVLTPDNECLQDSSCIIDYFEKHYTDLQVNPETPKQNLVSMLLEGYGDEWLLLPAMQYRWQYKRSNLWFILNEFGAAFGADYPRPLQPIVGVLPATVIYNAYRPLLGLSKTMGRAVEKSYEALITELDTHFEAYPYLLGDRPCMGDYGFIGPFYAHLYRDPHPKKMLKQRAPNLYRWVERMQFMQDARYGEFLPNDEIPSTLIPVLKRMVREQFPVLEATAKKLTTWIAKNPTKKHIPRVIGKHEFSIEGVEATRMIIPFSYWMFQRALNVYNSTHSTQETLDGFLKELGGLSAFENQLQHELIYSDYKLRVKK